MALAPHHVGTRCGMWRMHLGLYTSAQQFTGGMLQHNNVCVCVSVYMCDGRPRQSIVHRVEAMPDCHLDLLLWQCIGHQSVAFSRQSCLQADAQVSSWCGACKRKSFTVACSALFSRGVRLFCVIHTAL